MATLPEEFPIPSESSIASYNWTDIAEGTGIVKFYGFVVEDSTGISYKLSTNPFYSGGGIDAVETEAIRTSEISFTKIIDLDFDLSPFNLPQTIKGTATINYMHFCDGTTGGGSIGGESYIIFKLKKNDVEIASVQSDTFVIALAEGDVGEIKCVQITVPLTPFKKGDVLRITVEIWAKRVEANAPYIVFGHDPQNRDGTKIKPSSDDPTSMTKFEVFIPFKLDL